MQEWDENVLVLSAFHPLAFLRRRSPIDSTEDHRFIIISDQSDNYLLRKRVSWRMRASFQHFFFLEVRFFNQLLFYIFLSSLEVPNNRLDRLRRPALGQVSWFSVRMSIYFFLQGTTGRTALVWELLVYNALFVSWVLSVRKPFAFHYMIIPWSLIREKRQTVHLRQRVSRWDTKQGTLQYRWPQVTHV
jgi:hypothetical protein